MRPTDRRWRRGAMGGSIFFLTIGIWAIAEAGVALPPPDDIPEEVLRSQIILEGRSRVDGRPLSPVEYLAEEEDLGEADAPPKLDPEVRHLIFLLQIYNVLRRVLPFI